MGRGKNHQPVRELDSSRAKRKLYAKLESSKTKLGITITSQLFKVETVSAYNETNYKIMIIHNKRIQ